jgi:hypothetical protein
MDSQLSLSFPRTVFFCGCGSGRGEEYLGEFCFHLASSSLLVLPVPSEIFAQRGKKFEAADEWRARIGTGNLAMLKGHSETGQ